MEPPPLYTVQGHGADWRAYCPDGEIIGRGLCRADVVDICWEVEMAKDPIPPAALKLRLEQIAEYVLDTGWRNSGQTWLARQVGVTARTVRRWTKGTRRLSGLMAEKVRTVIKEELSS